MSQVNTYIKKEKISQINKLVLNLNRVKKRRKSKPKFNRRKEITKIRAEINENYYNNNKKQSQELILQKVNKINKC